MVAARSGASVHVDQWVAGRAGSDGSDGTNSWVLDVPSGSRCAIV